jgi:hypothetical protein
MEPVDVASFKLRLVDRRVRVVPRHGNDGCPFAGPGVDLLGADAELAIAAAGPLLAALARVEPGVSVRSVAVDLDRRRVLATIDPLTPEADRRGRVVRIDGGHLLDAMIDATGPVIAAMAPLVRATLARRKLPTGTRSIVDRPGTALRGSRTSRWFGSTNRTRVSVTTRASSGARMRHDIPSSSATW